MVLSSSGLEVLTVILTWTTSSRAAENGVLTIKPGSQPANQCSINLLFNSETWSIMLQVVGEAHKDALLSMSGLNRSLHTLVTDLRRVCEEVRSSTHRCLRAIDHASSLLQQSFISHQQACR